MEEDNRNEGQLGGRKKCWKLLRGSKAELLIFLYSLSYYMPSSFLQNLILQKQCLQKYSNGGDYCLTTAINKTLEEELQQEAAHLILGYYLLSQLPAVVLALFLGNWSDTYGRRWLLLAPCLGDAVSLLLYWLNSIFLSWPAEYLLLSALPSGLGGGYALFMMGLFGFVHDVHPLSSLSLRVSLADGCEGLASQLGPLLAGRLFQLTPNCYAAVFWACLVFLLLAIVSIHFLVDDVHFKKPTITDCSLKDLLNVSSLKDTFLVVCKKRRGNQRAYLFNILFTGFLVIFINAGTNEILFLYTRLKVSWDVLMLNWYNGLVGAATTLGNCLLLPLLTRVFHWTDLTLGLIGLLAFSLYSALLSAATTTATVFIAAVCQMGMTLAFVTFRSMTTKCVNLDEIGKMFAVFAVMSAVSSNVGQIVATQLYAATYRHFPPAFFCLANGLLLLPLTSFTWMYVDVRRRGITLEALRGAPPLPHS